MRKRLEDFLPDFKANLLDLETIVASLEAYQPVAARISQDVEARRVVLNAELRSSLEPVIRKELEERNSTAVAELARVLQEIATAETTRADLLLQVETLTRSAGELKTTLAFDLGTIHDALEDAPTEASGTVDAIVGHVSQGAHEHFYRDCPDAGSDTPMGLGGDNSGGQHRR